jgi:hypothetical protein
VGRSIGDSPGLAIREAGLFVDEAGEVSQRVMGQDLERIGGDVGRDTQGKRRRSNTTGHRFCLIDAEGVGRD